MMVINIIKDSGKEIELSEDEYKELQMKLGQVVKEPYYVPYTPDPNPYQPFPGYPNQPWITWCSDSIKLNSYVDDLK